MSTGNFYDEDDWNGEEYDEYDLADDDLDREPECSPAECGECWLGDGLCNEEIERQASEAEDYEKKYVRQDVPCPVCNVPLTRYEIPTDTLFVWPGVWPDGAYYSPIIALSIFAVLGAQKGEVHESIKDATATYHHIWVGTGEFRSEKLITLTGNVRNESAA